MTMTTVLFIAVLAFTHIGWMFEAYACATALLLSVAYNVLGFTVRYQEARRRS